MSAPNAGRQSPEPSRQPGGQQQEAQAKPNDQGVASSASQPQDDSKATLNQLASNPTHVLAQASEEKTSKK